MTLQIEEVRSEKDDRESSVSHYKIVSYPADYTLKGLYDKWQAGEILIPKFQRGFVWTHKQASQLIESFLLGLPVPSIFLYKEPKQKHLVIDGQQRLKSVFAFFDGVLPNSKDFYLTGVAPNWEGKFYKDLDPSEDRRLRDSVLRAILVEQLDPKDDTSLYHIFKRLNTGGTTLTPQEIRNCIYHGPFNDFIIRLNQTPDWRELLGSSSPDNRMRDIELILRFFALFENLDNYNKPMKDFMSTFMRRHQLSTKVQKFEKSFLNTTQSVLKALGPKPFHIRRGLNAAVFDSVMVAFSSCDRIPPDIKTRYEKLNRNDAFREATTAGTTDVDSVKRRMSLAKRFLFS